MEINGLTPEEIILEDIKEWCEVKLFDGETWHDHMNSLSPKQYRKRLDEVIEIYWRDHILP
jgi:hypothetical protein